MHDWILTREAGPRLTLTVMVGSGSCDLFDRVEVTETESEVDIQAIVLSSDGAFGTGCTDDLNVRQVDVELSEPLGERMLTGCLRVEDGLTWEDGVYFDDVIPTGARDSCRELVETW